jgi:phospholipase C
MAQVSGEHLAEMATVVVICAENRSFDLALNGEKK